MRDSSYREPLIAAPRRTTRPALCTPAGMLDLNCAALRALLSRPVRALSIVVFGLLSLHAGAPNALADEWIVDDTSATVHLNGSWQRSTTTPGFYGADYLVHAPGKGPALVRWPFPASGTPGRYRVEVRFTSGPNRAAAAPYHVDASDASADVSVNQQVGGGAWHSLGTFTFAPRRGEQVSLSGEADGVVVADAVAWVGPLGTDASDDLADPARNSGGGRMGSQRVDSQHGLGDPLNSVSSLQPQPD